MEATNSKKKYKWHFGDRNDGRRVRVNDPFYLITPYIMRYRSDAHVYFEEKINISGAESWLRKQRENGYLQMGYLHIFVAAMVRLLSQKPLLNRFIAGQKIYARKKIQISLAVKKRMSVDAPETTVKMEFEPDATIYDVMKIVDDAVYNNKGEEAEKNSTDKAAKAFMICPNFIVRFLFWIVRCLDYVGLLPMFLNNPSPFHTSVFITDLGSLGIKPIYHHLYDFGTTSIFLAFGKKERVREIDKDGNSIERKYISVKAVNDERICDGYYYSSAFKLMISYLKDPSILETPPEEVFYDEF